MLELLQEALLLKISKSLNSAIEEISSEHDKKIIDKIVRLNHKKILVNLNNIPLPLSFKYIVAIEEGKIQIAIYDEHSRSLSEADCDLIINMTVGSLIRAKLTSLEHVIRDRDIELSGDLNIAMELQALLNITDLDVKLIIQEKLAENTSDAFAWQFMNLLDKVLFRINLKNQELAEQVSDYLQTERNILVHRIEVNKFIADVDNLRDDIARLEARIERL